jgi:hypothetical protein
MPFTQLRVELTRELSRATLETTKTQEQLLQIANIRAFTQP